MSNKPSPEMKSYMREQRKLAAKSYANNGGWLHRIIRRLTRRFWKSQVRAVVNYAYERGWIDSYALHELDAFANEMLAPRGRLRALK